MLLRGCFQRRETYGLCHLLRQEAALSRQAIDEILGRRVGQTKRQLLRNSVVLKATSCPSGK